MRKILVALTAVALLASCGKNDENNAQGNGVVPKKIIVRDANNKLEETTELTFANGKVVGVVKKDYDNNLLKTTEITTYSYEGNRLVGVKKEKTGSNDSQKTFFYENGKIVTMTEKEVGKNYSVTTKYTYEGDRLVKKVESKPITKRVNGMLEVGADCTEYQYTYKDNEVTKVKTECKKDANDVVVETNPNSETTIYTFLNGNLVKKQALGSVEEYKYDTKQNPERYSVVTPDEVFEVAYSKNNVVEETTKTSAKIIYEYIYNSNGYPTVKKKYEEEAGKARELEEITEYQY